MSHKNFFLSLVWLVAFGLAVVASSASYAQSSPCDPEYMDALEARAWMEAQREIAQNQNLIFKPDSVLEYTCFDRFLNRVASNSGYTQSGRIFSETDRWGYPVGLSSTTTDNALQVVVLSSLNAYLGSNFPDGFADTRSSVSYTANTSVSGGDYTCDMMGQIWHQVRCMEFMDENNSDSFRDFSWYAFTDPRQFRPPSFQCPVSGNNSIQGLQAQAAFGQARTAAFNGDEAMFDINNGSVTDGTPYLEDDMVSHLDMILPGTNCAGSAIVPTGVSIQRTDVNGGAPYDEFVCSKPGCSADPGGSCVP